MALKNQGENVLWSPPREEWLNRAKMQKRKGKEAGGGTNLGFGNWETTREPWEAASAGLGGPRSHLLQIMSGREG